MKDSKHKIIHKKTIQKVFFALFFVLCFEILLSPAPVFAKNNKTINLRYLDAEKVFAIESVDKNEKPEEKSLSTPSVLEKGKISAINNLPENPSLKVVSVSTRVITAYNSEVGQCDDTPCITANGFNVCEHGIEDTVAANWLKFGTKIKIPELFGDRVFIVRDRMNRKYSDRLDVWMINKQDALKFGKRVARVEVLE